jgi:proline dehydrogenase
MKMRGRSPQGLRLFFFEDTMSGIPFYARRWVSGATMAEALQQVVTLNAKNISVTLDLLGENITSLEQAKSCTDEYVDMLDRIQEGKLSSHVSVKLTMLGLDINEDVCFENLKMILSKADKLGNRVALDMEGTPYTERTLRIYEAAAQQFKSPEIVLQAYLHRTEQDIERVLRANGRLRLCKGAYKEKPEHALQKMDDIVENYKKHARRLLKEANRVCLATHDDALIGFCQDVIRTESIPKERYEFQMLYGMRAKTWQKIADQGHNMTVYLPYGEHWQAYYSRRLAERKENIFFVLKNLFRD